MRSQRCLTRSSSLHSKSYLYGIAFSRPACLFYLGAVIDPLHGKKINRIVGCTWNVDALIVRNFREKHWENILQRGNTIYRRESCRREKVAILENSQSPSVVQTGWYLLGREVMKLSINSIWGNKKSPKSTYGRDIVDFPDVFCQDCRRESSRPSTPTQLPLTAARHLQIEAKRLKFVFSFSMEKEKFRALWLKTLHKIIGFN